MRNLFLCACLGVTIACRIADAQLQFRVLADLNGETSSTLWATGPLADGTPVVQVVDGVRGSILWRTDGTDEGTVDISPPLDLTSVGVYFRGNVPGLSIFQAWRQPTVGDWLTFNPATRQWTTIFHAPNDSGSSGVSGDRFFFSGRPALDPETPQTLRCYDPAVSQVPFIVATPGLYSFAMQQAAMAGGSTYLAASADRVTFQLYVYDAAQQTVAPVNTPADFSLSNVVVGLGSSLFLKGTRAGSGFRLWRYDTQTGVLGEVPRSDAGVAVDYWITAGDWLHFEMLQSGNARRIMSYNAATGESLEVQLPSSSPSPLLAVQGGTVFFGLSVNGQGTELYRFESGQSQASIVADVRPGPSSGFSGYVGDIQVADVNVFFVGEDGVHGPQIYEFDAANAARRVTDLPFGTQFERPFPLMGVGDRLLFSANDGVHGNELWISDGTQQGTRLFRDFTQNTAGSAPAFFRETPGGVTFSAYSPNTGREAYITDGTVAGTHLLRDICPGPCSSFPTGWTSCGGLNYFLATDSDPNIPNSGHGAELWATDGTAGGTYLVRDLRPGPQSGFGYTPSDQGYADQFSPLDDGTLLIYPVPGSQNRREVWRTEGTSKSTQRVYMPSFFSFDNPFHVSIGGKAYFSYDVGVSSQLWVSDGTTPGTHPVAGVTDASEIFYPTVTSDRLYFRARRADIGDELWYIDLATGAGGPIDLNPGPATASPDVFLTDGTNFACRAQVNGSPSLVWIDGATHEVRVFPNMWADIDAALWNDRVIFRTGATGPFAPNELAELNPHDGSVQVYDIAPGDAWSYPNGFVRVRGALIFMAGSPATGYELWRLDPMTRSPALLADMNPGTASSSPQYMTLIGPLLYLRAFTPDVGEEPMVADLCPADWDLDGTPTAADITLFFEAWDAGGSAADLNGSGGTPDDADIDTFFKSWTNGC